MVSHGDPLSNQHNDVHRPPKETEYEADIKQLRSDISMGKMLRARMDLTGERWGFGGLRTEGSVNADLSRVMGYLPQEMVKNLKLSGWAIWDGVLREDFMGKRRWKG